MRKIIHILLVFLITFFIGKMDVFATTCTYEMAAVGYYVDGKNYQPVDRKVRSKTTITYNTKDSKLKTDSFSSSEKIKISDNNFEKKVKKSGCPTYIMRTSRGNVSIIDKSKFISEVNKFSSRSNISYDYPLVLTKKDGKNVNEGLETLVNITTSSWTSIMSQDKYKNDEKIKKIEKSFISNMKSLSNSVYLNSSATWTKYAGNAQIENQIKNKQEQVNKLNSDYCSSYCSLTACKSQTNDTAKTACISSCNSSDTLSKCKNAISTCENISSSSEQSKCIENKFISVGLDPSYATDRANYVSDLNDEILNLKTKITRTTVPKLNIDFYQTYEVQCEDVEFLHAFWVVIKIGAPIITIIFVSIDMFKCVVSGDQSKVTEARKKAIKRVIAALLIFLTFTLVEIIVGISRNENVSNTKLLECVVNGK